MTDYTREPDTPSQLRRLSEGLFESYKTGSMTASQILAALRGAGAADKKGVPLADALADMAGRRDAALILNLAGDDPEARIDAWLASHRAELLARGAALLARAGGCGEILILAPEDTDASAVREVLSEGWRGRISLAPCQSSLVLREDTAVYSFLERGEIWPDPEGHAYRKTFPTQGFQGRPTLVVDGETACDAHCRIMMPEAPQTKLIAIRSAKETTLAEAALGTPLSVLLDELGLGIEKAALLGGALGRFISAREMEELQVGFGRLFDGMRLYANADCMAAECSRLMRVVREQSCGKCVMCREGSYHLDLIFGSVTEGKAKREDISLAEDIAPLIAEGSLCGFGKGMPGPAISALALHRGEIEAHVLKKTCPAGKCAAFLDYVIDPMLCTGCGECMDACEDDAIEGRKGFIHMIDPKACVKCGKCREICPENAVLVGADIRTPRKLTKVGMFNA